MLLPSSLSNPSWAGREIRPRQIVGIVGNVKHFGVAEEAPPFIYAPFEQQPAIFPGGAARAHLHKALVLRTLAGPAGKAANFATGKRAIAEVDASQPVTSIMTIEEVLWRQHCSRAA